MIPSNLVPELRAAQQHLQNIEKSGIKTVNLSLMEAKEAMFVLARVKELVAGLLEQANERLTIEEIL